MLCCFIMFHLSGEAQSTKTYSLACQEQNSTHFVRISIEKVFLSNKTEPQVLTAHNSNLNHGPFDYRERGFSVQLFLPLLDCFCIPLHDNNPYIPYLCSGLRT